MKPPSNPPAVPAASPCIGVCRLDEHGLCVGCGRTGAEISAWRDLDEVARRAWMREVFPARATALRVHREARLAAIVAALHPLAAAPDAPGWNRGEYEDLLPARGQLAPAAVLVGLVPRGGDWNVLLTLRTAALRQHAGQVSFPGGRIETGDADAVAAAIREAHEEIGLAAAAVQPLGYLDPFDTISAYHVLPVVARVDATYTLTLDPREVDDAFEVPLQFLLDPGNVRRVEREFAGRRRSYHEYVHGGHRIWGATAAMLVNLRERLGAAQ